MNELKIINQNGQLVVTSRKVAEDFGKEHPKVIRSIETLIEGIAKNGETYNHLFIESEYQEEQNKQFYKEYLLTRDGFSLLVMGFTGQEALKWKLKYIEAFNDMEAALKNPQPTPTCIEDLIILQAQSIKDMKLQIETAKKETEAVKNEVQDMREVIEIRPSDTWRNDTNNLIKKICMKLNNYSTPKEEAYKALQERGGCDLKTRLKNMRGRIALEGATKTKIDNLNYLDVIAENKRLVEIYTAIVKEMAIKYKVA